MRLPRNRHRAALVPPELAVRRSVDWPECSFDLAQRPRRVHCSSQVSPNVRQPGRRCLAASVLVSQHGSQVGWQMHVITWARIIDSSGEVNFCRTLSTGKQLVYHCRAENDRVSREHLPRAKAIKYHNTQDKFCYRICFMQHSVPQPSRLRQNGEISIKPPIWYRKHTGTRFASSICTQPNPTARDPIDSALKPSGCSSGKCCSLIAITTQSGERHEAATAQHLVLHQS